jgi:hypothetical protein
MLKLDADLSRQAAPGVEKTFIVYEMNHKSSGVAWACWITQALACEVQG